MVLKLDTPRYGDACSAKIFEVLHLILSTDCSHINWLLSVLKIRGFENLFMFSFSFWKSSVTLSWRGGIVLVSCLGRTRSCCANRDKWTAKLFCIANHSATSQLFGDRISAPCPGHARTWAQKRPPRAYTGFVFNRNYAGKFGYIHL